MENTMDRKQTGACLIFKHEETVFAENCVPQIGAMQQLQLKLLMSAGDRKNPDERQLLKPELYKIVYSDKENNQKFSKELSEVAESLKQIKKHIEEAKDDNSKKELRKLVRELLDNIRFLFKASHYSEEREVRVVQICYYDGNMTQEKDGIKVDMEQIPPRFYLETSRETSVSAKSSLALRARGVPEWKRWLKERDITLSVTRSKIQVRKAIPSNHATQKSTSKMPLSSWTAGLRP